jgi:hypothetical protein
MLSFLNIKPEFFKLPILSIASGCGAGYRTGGRDRKHPGNDNPFDVVVLRWRPF